MKIKKLLPAWLGLLLLLCGCQKEKAQEPANPEEGIYSVYYRDAALTSLTEKRVTCEEISPEKIVDFLVEEMRQVKDRSDQYISVIPDTAVYKGCDQDGDVMYVQFDSFYSALTAPEQVLFRAALTKTITQIPSIDYVSVTADHQPLMDAAGQPVGFMEAADFVDVLGRDVNTMNHTTLVLYYANKEGSALMTEKLTATYSSSFSIEKFIVERLIEGPESEECYETMPSGTKVISVATKDGVCYVNLSDDFLTNKLDVSADITIYSIVNSLTELSHVNSVQIMVEGSADVNFRNEISLDAPLSRKLEYVDVEEK